ncbi:polyketide cyclase / dehydrase and lipid transport [Actinomycetospora sp. OC33-EN08]|uniref:Polyketide cyclase / dehydrase and lipid transport n=1 Tax=Actinomycetospora aurantiaca TaxID=3129233 RepID=A0ABU8MV16_9PSEU
MAALDVIDETFVLAEPAVVAAAFADPADWPHRWPDLELHVFADRGAAGLRWSVTGRWVGSAEVWCEPVGDGTVLHWFLRLDPAPGPDGGSARALLRGPRGPAREALRRQRAAKAIAFELKARLEGGPDGPRRPGTPAVGT